MASNGFWMTVVGTFTDGQTRTMRFYMLENTSTEQARVRVAQAQVRMDLENEGASLLAMVATAHGRELYIVGSVADMNDDGELNFKVFPQ